MNQVKLEKKLSSIEDQGQTDRVWILHKSIGTSLLSTFRFLLSTLNKVLKELR